MQFTQGFSARVEARKCTVILLYFMIIALASIAVALAAQPPKAPKEKKFAKNSDAQSAGKSNNASKPQELTQTGNPPATPSSATTTDQPPAKASESNVSTEAENQKVQGRIEIFTGMLVLVGAVQSVVMVLQWCIYRRQAREMRRQRHEMRHQRNVMHRQWKEMRGQLTEIGKQTALAQTNAETALRSVKLQEAHMGQSVEIDGWEIHAHGIQANWIYLGFTINNPGPLLIVLRSVEFGGEWHLGPVSTIRKILPNRGTHFDIPVIPLNGGHLEAFDKNRLEFMMTMKIGFETALKELQVDDFMFKLLCGRDRDCKVEAIPGFPLSTNPNGGDNPN